jgi:hypothetical protein
MNRLAALALLLISVPSFTQDIKSDLFGENEAAKSYFDSFKMDCSQQTAQCIERKLAIDAENNFNDIFIIALDRDMQIWPNGELEDINEALNLRKDADFDFGDGYFGNAEKLYLDAIEAINNVLNEADIIVRENLEIGEQYLYEDGKPGWAAPYFNDSLIYDPNNKRISKGLSRIRFLQSFEDDVIVINEYLDTGMYKEALRLIDGLIDGDPGNVTLMDLQKRASQGEVGAKIDDQLFSFKVSLNESATIQDKEALLSKIDNALSVYGSGEPTQEIRDLKKEIEEQIYDEVFNELQENFINDSKDIESLYADSNKLLSLYPRDRDAISLASKISEKRNSGILELLYAESSNLRLKEEWNDALTKHQEIYNITKSTDDNNVVSSLKLVIKRLESIKTYTSEPTSYLNTLEKIDEAKWLLKETQKFSSSDTNKLNQTIIDFQSLIATYEELVLEDNKNKKDKVRATNKSQPNPSSKPNGSSSERSSAPVTNSSQNNNTPVIKTSPKTNSNPNRGADTPNNSNTKVSGKAKLDMNSFMQNIACTKRIRNKPMSALFEIKVTSNGKAQTVALLNGDELKMSSRDKEIINVVTKSLRNSNYKPAKSGDVYISTTITKKLNIPSYFCS